MRKTFKHLTLNTRTLFLLLPLIDVNWVTVNDNKWHHHILKGILKPKLHHCFYGIFLLVLWIKKSFIRLHEVLKLQSFEFSVSDVIYANVQNISPLIFFAFFVSIMEKKIL